MRKYGIYKINLKMDGENMISKNFTIQNKVGLDVRPAVIFVQECNRFICEITLKKGNKTVNAKSVIGVMAIAAGYGDEITVITDGTDEEKAMQDIEVFFNERIQKM